MVWAAAAAAAADDDDDVVLLCSSWTSKGAVGGCDWSNALHDGMDSSRRAKRTNHWISLLIPVQYVIIIIIIIVIVDIIIMTFSDRGRSRVTSFALESSWNLKHFTHSSLCKPV